MQFVRDVTLGAILSSLLLSAPAQAQEEILQWQKDSQYRHSIATQWTLMADRYLDEGDIDRALPLYDKALSLDKNFAPAYHNRAQVYAALSRNEEALTDLNRCIALGGSEQPLALHSLGILQLRMHHYNEAIAAFNRLMAPGGHNEWLLTDRASCYEGMGKFDLAAADLTAALKTAPHSDFILSRRARVYYDLKQYDKAIADLTEVINLDPDGSKSKDANVAVLKLRAEIYRKIGKDALAKRDLDRLEHTYKVDDALAPFTK